MIMKRNMDQWLKDMLAAKHKKTMPILSFPGIQLMGVSVDAMVRDGELQAKCMEAIAKRYDMAASLSLMDLSVEAEAFGSPVKYSENEVPTVTAAIIAEPEDAEKLLVPPVGAGRTGEYLKAVELAAKAVQDRPVFAGAIGPFSLAGRLLDMTEIMVQCYDDPDMVKLVLDKATEFIIAYMKAFKEKSANGVVMAEPAAGLLSPSLIAEFSNPYVRKIREAVEDENFLFIYHNCGNTIPLMKEIVSIGMRVLHLGNSIKLEDALGIVPRDMLVMGNISPANEFRQGMPASMQKAVDAMFAACGSYPNFVISSGCDIPPASPMENIDAYFKAVAAHDKI